MTCRRSPHYAAVVRAQLRRRADAHKAFASQVRLQLALLEDQRMRQKAILEHARDAGHYARQSQRLGSLQDPRAADDQKAQRWRWIWGDRG